ncbi:MAG: hypothetical protein JWO70_907 [Betaproteobacteria bacterium]|nr:hypothetical protein [Betaproteobacteria bacterium]
MLRLTVEVPEARDRTAIATLRDGSRIVAMDHAVAAATPAVAAAHGNPACDPLRRCGHPPLGRYAFVYQQPAQGAQQQEYGAQLLLFQPQSGAALEAEAFGRLALLVYGGRTGRDKNMRRTQGGLRLSDTMLRDIVSRLKSAGELQLDLLAWRDRSWWQFWKRPSVATRPLSTTGPTMLAPPLDELSLMEMLLQKAPKRVPRAASDPRDNDASDRDRSDRSSSGAAGETFQGKGGTGGGAGASGSWAGAGGAAPVVDSAGRIVGAVAVAGAVGAIAMSAMTHEAQAASRHDAEGELGDSNAASSATDTTTAY